MYKVPLSKTKVETKLAIIREAILELEKIGKELTQEQFVADKEKFAVAEHYLRRALEAAFDIGGHIISRFAYSPGKRPKTIKEIAVALGEKGIIEKTFADNSFVNMAGYRNRLVHFYDEITPKELYKIIKNNLSDLEVFAGAVVELVNNPERLGLGIED